MSMPKEDDVRGTEPPVWVPKATGTIPSATPAAEPLDEPPGVRAASCGLAVTPGSIPANSQVTVLRSEEHTSELQSLMRISYAVFCLKKQTRLTYETSYQN